MRALKIIVVVYLATYAANILFHEVMAALSGTGIDGELMAGMMYFAAVDAIIVLLTLLASGRLTGKDDLSLYQIALITAVLSASASAYNSFFYALFFVGELSFFAYIANSFLVMLFTVIITKPLIRPVSNKIHHNDSHSG